MREAVTIVIHNAVIATVDDRDTLHYGAAIAIDGDRITAIGPSAEILARHPAAEKVDGTGKMVMPGFANVHTHFTMTLARGVFEDLSPPHKPPFSGGLSPIPLPDMTPDERRAMALLGALEALRSGTTLVLEDTNDVDDYAAALAGTGMRFLLSERAYDRVGTSIGDPAPFKLDRALGQRHLRTIEDAHKKWNGKADGRIRIAASAWAPDMCSPELLKDLRALQQQLDTWATIHCNQIWGEVAAVKAHRNRLPTEYLADLGFLHDRLICAHCRCMEPSEEKLLGEAGVTVAFNAAIAARRGLSPRIADLESSGCTIAMGSDNMAEDMVEVLRTGLFMERIRREDGRNPTPEQALRWATRNGYRALGVPDGGWLKAGNKADLIMVDVTGAHMVPVLRAVSTFVHQAQARDVEAVMVDGRWLMKDGKVLAMDEEAVLAEAQRVANTAWPRLFAKRRDLKVPEGFSPDALP
jgi:5-methylthioadenosine/S-adenosylhomocysteine deaminase